MCNYEIQLPPEAFFNSTLDITISQLSNLDATLSIGGALEDPEIVHSV
jgi:hypothetical protein